MYHRAYIAAKKAQGLKRLVLWVDPVAVDDLRLAAKQPHALARLTLIEPGQAFHPQVGVLNPGKHEGRSLDAADFAKGQV